MGPVVFVTLPGIQVGVEVRIYLLLWKSSAVVWNGDVEPASIVCSQLFWRGQEIVDLGETIVDVS